MPINHTAKTEDERPENKSKKTDVDFVLTDAKFAFEDIVLETDTLQEIKNVIALDTYKDLIFNQWGLSTVMKGVRNISINLYGCSGTGKTMTAHAIASMLEKKILFVNYAEIESKYVGETSKNLVKLFACAEENDAIILFDEADALLSKRVTAMHSATDVSVNQTRNVLLRILDTYQGIVIFTTNFIQNFDFAFLRRISSHIRFDMPNEETRIQLWTHYLPLQLPLEGQRDDIIKSLSTIENLTGSDISMAVLKAAVQAAVTKGSVSEELLIGQINKILATKKSMDNDGFTVTSKKVTQEYVESKLMK